MNVNEHRFYEVRTRCVVYNVEWSGVENKTEQERATVRVREECVTART